MTPPGIHASKLTRSVHTGRVAATLRQAIVSGELESGTPLVELHLAARLSVSRGPVRSALQALESEGLVKTLENGRTVVAGFDEQDLQDLFSVRYELESTAIKWGIGRNNSTTSLVGAFEALAAEGSSTARIVDLDLDFHRALVEFSGSRYLVQSWLAMVPVLHTVISIGNRRFAARERDHNFRRVIDFHRPIVEAVVAHDAAEAVAVLGAQFELAASLHARSGPAHAPRASTD